MVTTTHSSRHKFNRFKEVFVTVDSADMDFAVTTGQVDITISTLRSVVEASAKAQSEGGYKASAVSVVDNIITLQGYMSAGALAEMGVADSQVDSGDCHITVRGY